MILILAKEIDLGRYIEVLNIANRFQYRLETIRHISWGETDLGKLGPLETLYISGHGSNDKVEGKIPDELAEALVAKGLKDRVKFKKIKLMCCGSGITTGSNIPYCQRLAAALATKGGPKDAVVVGFDGASTVCDQYGVLYAKDTAQRNYANWSEFVTNHQSNFDKWNASAKLLKCDNQTEFLENARMLISQPVVREAFEWLYRENEKYVKKDSSVGKTHADASKFWKKPKRKLSIKIDGISPNDPLVFDYEIRSAHKPHEIISGKTDAQGDATAQWMSEGEIRFSGFGAFGRVETQWQKILVGRYMTLQFGRYRFICETL
jgi:hypothetical protein